MRLICAYLFFIALCMGFYMHYTTMFSLPKIFCDLPAGEPPFETLPDLSQPFIYLSQGRQSFVFESADGKSVLKLINQDYFRSPWYLALPISNEWIDRQKLKIAYRLKFFEESYPLALSEFPEETGILYIHLRKTDKLLPVVALLDQSGRPVLVDLNRTAFILQKKALPYKTYMEEVSRKEGIAGLKREIDSLMKFTEERIVKRVADYDHDIWSNMGYLDGKIFIIDPGKYYRKESLAEPEICRQEIWKATHRLRKWFVNHDPEAAHYLDEVSGSVLEKIQNESLRNAP